MAALNQQETENLSTAERAMQDAAVRLQRAADQGGSDTVSIDRAEVAFMVDNLKKADRLVNTVKQMKGYYPK